MAVLTSHYIASPYSPLPPLPPYPIPHYPVAPLPPIPYLIPHYPLVSLSPQEAMEAVKFTYSPAVLKYKPPKRSFTDRLRRAKALMAEGLSPEEVERAQAIADGEGAEEALIESVRLQLQDEYGEAAAERMQQRAEER